MIIVGLAFGFLLGFIGYLPPGNINLTVVQMSVSSARSKWRLFILFAALMEFIYCFGCLYGMDRLIHQPQLILFLNWAAVLVFLLLGVSFILVGNKADSSKNSSTSIKKGILVAIFNPLQVPFWLIWGVYVFQNHLVTSYAASIALFSFICSLGTITILWFYAAMGKRLVEKMNINHVVLNRFIGSLLILLAVFQTIKLLQA